jgi:Protein of unknown function (DUF4199)
MKNFAIEIKWAINYSIAFMLWMIFEKSIGWHDVGIGKQMIYTNLFGFVALVIYYFAFRDKKRNFFNNTITFRQGFMFGVYLSGLIALFAVVTQYITYTFITPNYFDALIAEVVKNKKQTLEQAQAFFSYKSFLFQSIFGSLSIGIVTGAIIAHFLKTKNN